MAAEHIVVDGSNIATEGRSQPSLAQLEEAVTELKREHPNAEVTVIVDATFSHRIDPSELPRFESAALAGDYVHPPAGAIGRGDAFLLRVAEKVDGTVLSNDSFQEFHGEHPWLFERGRLMGATPVPGIGWIFTPRTPVRGPKSRMAVRDEERAKKKVSKAIAAATKEAVTPPKKATPKRAEAAKRADGPPKKARPAVTHTPSAVNDPLTFVSFIAEHPLGTEVDGQVDSYTSHGAVVMARGAQCYVPLANLAVPAPRSAKELLKRGEHRRFVVTALDPQRRGVELALPGVGVVSGRPSEDMIAAELRLAKKSARPKKAAPKKPAAKVAPPAGAKKAAPVPPPRKAAPVAAEPAAAEPVVAVPPVREEAPSSPRRSPAALKKAAKQSARPAKAATRRAPPPTRAPAEKGTPAKKAATGKAPAAAEPRTKKAAEAAKAAKASPRAAKKAQQPAKKAQQPAKKAQAAKKAQQPAEKSQPAKKAQPPAKAATATKAQPARRSGRARGQSGR